MGLLPEFLGLSVVETKGLSDSHLVSGLSSRAVCFSNIWGDRIEGLSDQIDVGYDKAIHVGCAVKLIAHSGKRMLQPLTLPLHRYKRDKAAWRCWQFQLGVWAGRKWCPGSGPSQP